MLDVALDRTHGLIRKPLKPQYARQRHACGDLLVELKAHQMRPMAGGMIAVEHMFDMPTRAGLISEEVQRDPGQSLADRPFGAFAFRREDAEPLRKRERVLEPAFVDAVRPKAPEGPQLIIEVVQRFRKLERARPGRARLAGGPGRVHPRPGQRGVDLHFTPFALACPEPERGDRLLHAAPAFLHQRKFQP
jgi:hypothetical protein